MNITDIEHLPVIHKCDSYCIYDRSGKAVISVPSYRQIFDQNLHLLEDSESKETLPDSVFLSLILKLSTIKAEISRYYANLELSAKLKKIDEEKPPFSIPIPIPVEKSQQPAEQAEKPAEKVAEKPAEKLAEKVAEKPAEKPAEKVAEKVEIKPLARQAVKLTEEESEMLDYIEDGIPVYLAGPAGCGKTTLAKKFAEVLGIPFYFSGAIKNIAFLSGYKDANGVFQETPFYKAFTKGGVFLFDEVDASDENVLTGLNAAIANGCHDFAGINCKAHPNFRIIGAGNTLGNGADDVYTGRNQLDGATLNRFAVFEVSYDKSIEDEIGGEFIAGFCRAFRSACEENGQFNTIISYRQIQMLRKMADKGHKPENFLKRILTARISFEDFRLVKNTVLDKLNKSKKFASKYASEIEKYSIALEAIEKEKELEAIEKEKERAL